jgi:hypothetical protein
MSWPRWCCCKTRSLSHRLDTTPAAPARRILLVVARYKASRAGLTYEPRTVTPRVVARYEASRTGLIYPYRTLQDLKPLAQVSRSVVLSGLFSQEIRDEGLR